MYVLCAVRLVFVLQVSNAPCSKSPPTHQVLMKILRSTLAQLKGGAAPAAGGSEFFNSVPLQASVEAAPPAEPGPEFYCDTNMVPITFME